jgi:hypothetical protein
MKKPKKKFDWSGLEDFRKTLPDYRRHESFQFIVAAWDIVRALYLLDKYPRETSTLTLENAPRVYGFEYPETSWYRFSAQAHEDERVDITRPVILALIDVGEENPDHLVIDGLNRMYKAWKLGHKNIPCYVLATEEADACRIR